MDFRGIDYLCVANPPIFHIMKFRHLLASVIAILTVSCSGNKTVDIPANDPSILYLGRIHWGDSLAPQFTYPGTTAMLNFEGSSISMGARPGSGQFMVEIDDREPFKINFTEADSLILLADSLPAGPHSARITYAIEGYDHHPEFRGFRLTDGNILPPPARPELKIEFIGNSITCGYGTEESDPQNGFSYDTENHTLTYAHRTARALDADFNIVARSGIGIYRNYNGPREGDKETMVDEYDNTMLYQPDHKWDFSKFQPDIVCINLGTNDTSTDNYDITLFEAKYRDFLRHLREVYPSAKIVLLTGSMMSGQPLDDVKGALDRLAADDPNFYRFDMSPQTGDLGYGADYHPSSRQAQKMGDELTAYLKDLISNSAK